MENPLDRSGSKTQGLNELAEDSKPQVQNELTEDSKPQDQKEQVEESKPQDLVEQVEENKPQDLKDWVEEQMASSTPMEMLEQEPEDMEAFDGRTRKRSTMTELEDIQSFLNPEPVSDDSTLLKQAEDSSEPEDLKKRIEESMNILMEIPEQRPQEGSIEKSYLSSYTVPRKTSKKQKTQAPSIPSKPPSLLSQSVPPKISPPRYIAPKPKPQTADKATQLRAIPIFPLRLPGLVKRPPRRSFGPEAVIKPPTSDGGTQISPSFERLMKRPPPLIKKRKSEDITSTNISSPKTTSPSLPKESRRLYRSSIERNLQKKRFDIERTPRSWKKSTTVVPRAPRSQKKLTTIERVPRSLSKLSTIERAPWSHSKLKKSPVTYNFYVNFCDCCKEKEPCDYSQSNWKECASCSGLSRACSVFSNLKSGGIHISDLLLTLHALGILVTHNEMQQTLKFLGVDAAGIVNFSDFLEAVNQTSPFADTDALQKALRAFRKIKRGMVAIHDLESVLANLGVNLSYEHIRQILRCPRVNKNEKVDLSNFFKLAKELEKPEEEEEACPNERTVWERMPFQDVSNLVSAKSRWRKKYGCFNEDICCPWSCSDDNITVAKQQQGVSWIPIAVSPVCRAERGNRDLDIMTKSQASFIGQRRPSTGFVQNAEAKKQDIVEMTKSQTGSADQGRRSSAEAENIEGGIVETPKSPADIADQGMSNTASIHKVEAEKKEGDIVEVAAS